MELSAVVLEELAEVDQEEVVAVEALEAPEVDQELEVVEAQEVDLELVAVEVPDLVVVPLEAASAHLALLAQPVQVLTLDPDRQVAQLAVETAEVTAATLESLVMDQVESAVEAQVI